MRSQGLGLAIAVLLAAAAPGCKGSTDGPESSGADAEATGSGLVYTEVRAGSGDSPAPTDTVVVHYHGTFPDGGVFDSSIQRGEPARFPLNRVIPCWTEALQKMRVGGKANLVCPPEIAYGARGAGPIPPNATLHFAVELIDIAR